MDNRKNKNNSSFRTPKNKNGKIVANLIEICSFTAIRNNNSNHNNKKYPNNKKYFTHDIGVILKYDRIFKLSQATIDKWFIVSQYVVFSSIILQTYKYNIIS